MTLTPLVCQASTGGDIHFITSHILENYSTVPSSKRACFLRDRIQGTLPVREPGDTLSQYLSERQPQEAVMENHGPTEKIGK
jgi:hypothetical protein